MQTKENIFTSTVRMSSKSLPHRTFYLSVFLGLLLACSPAPPLLPTPPTELVLPKVIATIVALQTPSLAALSVPTASANAGLSIQGNQFAKDGKTVILQGAVVPHFIYQQIVDYP